MSIGSLESFNIRMYNKIEEITYFIAFGPRKVLIIQKWTLNKCYRYYWSWMSFGSFKTEMFEMFDVEERKTFHCEIGFFD